MNALFREGSKPCGWSGGNTPTSQPAVGELNSAPSLGRQKMIEQSWFCGRMRVRSNLPLRFARVRAGCFAYVHATVGGGRVSHHQYLNPNHSRLGFFLGRSRVLPRVVAGSCGNLRTLPTATPSRFCARFALFRPFLSVSLAFGNGPKSTRLPWRGPKRSKTYEWTNRVVF